MALTIGMIIRPRGGDEWLRPVREAVDRLRGEGHRVEPRLTFETGDARRFARAAACARYDLIIVAGGDGTVNEVVNGITGCPWQPRVGIVPVGTANDFAAGMGIPTTVEEAVRVAVDGRPTAVDVACVNDRHFINVSTGGFGAEASERASPEIKRRLGTWAYLITGVRSFAGLKPARARFRTGDEVAFDGDFLIFAVGNARQTGGGTRLTPRAIFGDGKLDLLIVPAMPAVDFLALIPDLRAGRHLQHPDVVYLQRPTIRVEAGADLNVNADGEPIRGRRFDYRLGGRPLTIMAADGA